MPPIVRATKFGRTRRFQQLAKPTFLEWLGIFHVALDAPHAELQVTFDGFIDHPFHTLAGILAARLRAQKYKFAIFAFNCVGLQTQGKQQEPQDGRICKI